MKYVAVVGTRGFDVIYSGYETFVKKLVEKSEKSFFYHLFVRSSYQRKMTGKYVSNYNVIKTPTIPGKYLETFFYVLFITTTSIFKKIDVVLFLGTTNTSLIFIQKILGRKTIVNTAGIDWQKKRWSFLGKWYLKICERFTVWFADIVICDSKTVYKYYQNKYNLKNIVYIPYGASVNFRKSGKLLQKYGLKQNKYIYTVGRFSPENCFEDLIQAFKKIQTDLKCVIVGDSFYEERYKCFLQNLAKDDKRIIFTGILKGADYDEICSNSYAFIDTKSIGGTHPSLLDAMSLGKYIIAKNIPESIEVLGLNGIYYDKKLGSVDLEKKILYIIRNGKSIETKSKFNKQRIDNVYSWERVIREYNENFINS